MASRSVTMFEFRCFHARCVGYCPMKSSRARLIINYYNPPKKKQKKQKNDLCAAVRRPLIQLLVGDVLLEDGDEGRILALERGPAPPPLKRVRHGSGREAQIALAPA